MKTYNVKEISEMLNTNPETVRRWIRSGKLPAQQLSRKDGNVVKEDALFKFLQSSGKYAGIATAMAVANPIFGIGALLGTTIGAGVLANLSSDTKKNNEDFRVISDDLVETLKSKKSKSEELIRKKKAMIKQLNDDINREEQNIRECEIALKNIEYLKDKESVSEGE